MSSTMDFLMQHAAMRWFCYAATFGALWGGVVDALLFGDHALRAVFGGLLAGIFFATVAVRRETRGLRRRRRPREP